MIQQYEGKQSSRSLVLLKAWLISESQQFISCTALLVCKNESQKARKILDYFFSSYKLMKKKNYRQDGKHGKTTLRIFLFVNRKYFTFPSDTTKIWQKGTLPLQMRSHLAQQTWYLEVWSSTSWVSRHSAPTKSSEKVSNKDVYDIRFMGVFLWGECYCKKLFLGIMELTWLVL